MDCDYLIVNTSFLMIEPGALLAIFLNYFSTLDL